MPGLHKPVPATVRASIDFLDPLLTEKPFSCVGAPPPGIPATNIKPYPIEVHRFPLFLPAELTLNAFAA